jgi:hypothetical protein
VAGPAVDPAPFDTPMVGEGGKITKWWANWFALSLLTRVQSQAPAVAAARVGLTGQNTSIGTTALIASAPEGLYRISWRIRITQVASVNSSILLTISAVDGGVTTTQASAAYTGNVTNAPQSGVFIVACDGASALSYATTYASNLAGEMEYSLSVVVEAL